MSLTALAIASIIGAIATTTASAIQNSQNIKAQKEANATNLQLTKEANELQMEMAERANAFSASEAQKNRDWQTEMSNTQYQRAMADMKAAGLNPILAANASGAGVSSVGNAGSNMAAISAGNVSPVKNDWSTGITNAIQGINNMMLLSYMADSRADAMKYRSDAIYDAAQERNKAYLKARMARSETYYHNSDGKVTGYRSTYNHMS